MQRRYIYSVITTLINLLLAISCLVTVAVILFAPEDKNIFDLISKAMAKYGLTGNNGGDALGSLLMSFMGIFAAILVIAVIIFFGIFFILLITTDIVGLVSIVRYHRNPGYMFKGDSIVKIIIDGIIAILCFGSVSLLQPWWLLPGLAAVAVITLSIISLSTYPKYR